MNSLQENEFLSEWKETIKAGLGVIAVVVILTAMCFSFLVISIPIIGGLSELLAERFDLLCTGHYVWETIAVIVAFFSITGFMSYGKTHSWF